MKDKFSPEQLQKMAFFKGDKIYAESITFHHNKGSFRFIQMELTGRYTLIDGFVYTIVMMCIQTKLVREILNPSD